MIENYTVERIYTRIVNGDYTNEPLIESSQLRTCNARVYVYPSIIILQSYNTVVAFIDRKERVLIDVGLDIKRAVLEMKAKEYIIRGYVRKETGYNIVLVYKTKLSAKKRFDKMVASGCYEYIEMEIFSNGKCIGGRSYEH